MSRWTPELPPEAWRRVLRQSGVLTAGSIALSVALTAIILSLFGIPLIAAALVCAIAAPVTLAGPLLFLLTLQKAQLREVNKRLATMASTDSLTNCLNRGAFISRVTPILNEADADAVPGGALLIVDADNFKSINDSFGHDCGDEALKSIAEAIRSAIRNGDIVGRIGGEEFGVFLRGAGHNSAERAAERIRETIASAGFAPRGQQHRLSASVGGAVFRGPVAYKDLYRMADHRLYAAKRSGRDRSMIADVANDDGPTDAKRPAT